MLPWFPTKNIIDLWYGGGPVKFGGSHSSATEDLEEAYTYAKENNSTDFINSVRTPRPTLTRSANCINLDMFGLFDKFWINMKKLLFFLLILTITLTSIACQLLNTSKQGQKSNKPDNELIDYAVSVAQMKGHLRSSLAGIKEKDNTVAELHVEHPIEEGLVSTIEATLRERDAQLADDLNSTFDDLASQAAEGQTSKVKKAMTALDEALNNVVPEDKLSDPSFRKKVLSKLFTDIKNIYTMGISEDGAFIQAEADYQDAYGIYHETKFLYKEIALSLSPQAEQEIDTQLKTLDKTFIKVNLDVAPVAPSTVAKVIDEIVKELG